MLKEALRASLALTAQIATPLALRSRLRGFELLRFSPEGALDREASSMGLKSGEYGGRKISWQSPVLLSAPWPLIFVSAEVIQHDALPAPQTSASTFST
jgi:hypothetical protein